MIHIITPPFDATPLRGVTREFVDIFTREGWAVLLVKEKLHYKAYIYNEHFFMTKFWKGSTDTNLENLPIEPHMTLRENDLDKLRTRVDRFVELNKGGNTAVMISDIPGDTTVPLQQRLDDLHLTISQDLAYFQEHAEAFIVDPSGESLGRIDRSLKDFKADMQALHDLTNEFLN